MKPLHKFFNKKVHLWIVLTIFLGLLGVYIYGYGKGFLSHNNQQTSQIEMSQVTKYLEKTQEHVFLNVGIQHVATQKNNTRIPWTKFNLPGSEKKAIIVLHYEAKFGIKEPVHIEEVEEKSYRISVPKFSVIGFALDEKKPYQLYDQSGGFLSVATKEVDTGKLATQALSEKEHQKYLSQYTSYLRESAEEYYTHIFKAIDPEIQVQVVFAE